MWLLVRGANVLDTNGYSFLRGKPSPECFREPGFAFSMSQSVQKGGLEDRLLGRLELPTWLLENSTTYWTALPE
jgi:hypothetical protein